MEVIFASQNKGKTKEIQALIPDHIRVQNLAELGITQELEEPFLTLEENAMHKARQVFALTGKASFADDTGLEIDALEGRPGVLSARYAGEAKDPVANMKKVLGEMKDAPHRSARFRTVIAYKDSTQELLFEGEVAGIILTEMRGSKGFGYDPFFVPDGSTRTFAEMEMQEKNEFSHRAKAVMRFIEFMSKQ